MLELTDLDALGEDAPGAPGYTRMPRHCLKLTEGASLWTGS